MDNRNYLETSFWVPWDQGCGVWIRSQIPLLGPNAGLGWKNLKKIAWKLLKNFILINQKKKNHVINEQKPFCQETLHVVFLLHNLKPNRSFKRPDPIRKT